MQALPLLQKLLREVVCKRSEYLSVDRHTSTEARQAANFIAACAGTSHPNFSDKRQSIEQPGGPLAEFFLNLQQLVAVELRQTEQGFYRQVDQASATKDPHEALYALLFPEGLGLRNKRNRPQAIEQLRRKRLVKIAEPVADPINDPVNQMLVTSNVLLTRPLDKAGAQVNLSASINEMLEKNADEPQKFWYDHPVPLGIDPAQNEVLYGLRGLQNMLEQDPLASSGRLPVVLSVSTTHDHLHALAKPYLNYVLAAEKTFDRLDVHIFTEEDTRRLNSEVLQPLAKAFFPHAKSDELNLIIGVDGEYGRHYSFLKAVAALWQVFVQPQIKATFKIDLDQVFPQQALQQQTGMSALQHFCTPWWGARATDSSGHQIELSLLAGALVNQADFANGLFTPDVRFPETDQLKPDELVFFSRLPQAVSTAAEMMYRGSKDGSTNLPTALQRVHVTGGTNGIRVDALFKHRPFTPTFVGRAEDQAYLMSVLDNRVPGLRYLHQPGLIMRHDKEAFAGQAISAAATGKTLGDYMRILLFSAYGRILPQPLEQVKETMDPFSGAFISYIPKTVVALRFALHILALESDKKEDALHEFCQQGVRRLTPLLENEPEYKLAQQFKSERKAWDLYYNVLLKAQQHPDHPVVLEACESVKRLVADCRVGI